MAEDRNITLTRAVACLMIVLVHVGEQRYYNSNMDSLIFEISALAIIIGRVAVPIFFMISGFLLFSKNNPLEFDTELVKKRFLAIFLPLLYFTSIYYAYTVLRGYGFNPFNNQFFSRNIAHLWYLAYILPVYTLSPFIHIPKIKDTKQILVLLGFLTFLFFITESMMSKPYAFNVPYSFNQALLYMFIGCILKQFRFSNRYISLIFAGVFIFFIQVGYLLLLFEKDFIFSEQYGGSESFNKTLELAQYLFGGQEGIISSYKTLAVFLQSLSLFLFFQSLNLENLSQKVYAPISYLAKNSLKIYGWHMLFVIFIGDMHLPWNALLVFVISFMGGLGGSLFCVYFENGVNLLKKHSKTLKSNQKSDSF